MKAFVWKLEFTWSTYYIWSEIYRGGQLMPRLYVSRLFLKFVLQLFEAEGRARMI